MEYIIVFLIWSFTLYWIHRGIHKINIPYVSEFHWDHHKQVTQNKVKWHWSNIFLFNDTWKSTIDFWITEVIPTFIICIITNHWWIFCIFYIYASFIQERIEHNKHINFFPLLSAGKWHLIHHNNHKVNFGAYTPIWDIFFNTNKSLTNDSKK
jgi:sterol desaturase/sphingolipid hydroxylase (fatty acid hydroxylase superfamily)